MPSPQGFEGELKKFQMRDVAYLYFIRKALLANQTGLGKTIEMIALNCLIYQLGQHQGCVQVVPAQSLYQWYSEYRKFAPHLEVRIAEGRGLDRVGTYQLNFDVLLISYNVLWRDFEWVGNLPYNIFSTDEASIFKNDSTKTWDMVNALSKKAHWTIPMSATPIQKCITDLWSIMQVLNMERLLGVKSYFTVRYCIRDRVFVPGKNKVPSRKEQITGYKNIAELKQRINPFYLRRRATDPDVGEDLPVPIPDVRWLDLLPEQRRVYEDVKRDIINNNYRGLELRSRFILMCKIVAGMRTLDLMNPDISVKADETMRLLEGDLSEDKVVIFCTYKTSIRNLHSRFDAAGLRYATLWGDEPSKQVRWQIQEQFRCDPELRIIIGTTALEMSLNLQAAPYMINYDSLHNPARMTQLAGRIRRIGSIHHANIFISLFARGTHEEKLMTVLKQRQAVSDFVFEEESDLIPKLTDAEIYAIIRN